MFNEVWQFVRLICLSMCCWGYLSIIQFSPEGFKLFVIPDHGYSSIGCHLKSVSFG